MDFVKAFLKFIMWTAIIIGLIWGGLYLYDYLTSRGAIQKASDQATTLGKTVGTKAKEYANQAVSSTEATASSYVKSKIGEVVGDIGRQIISFGQNLGGVPSPAPVGSGITGLSDSPAIGTPPTATIAINIGKPLSFSVKSDNTYQVDWGDGNSDEGTTATSNPVALQHVWQKVGDYMVKMTVGNGGGNNTYSFPVRVY
jgi:PKD repeat protein